MKDKARAIRRNTGLSQVAFAKRYGIPRRTIENWESGKTEPPEYVLSMLARIVEIDIKEHK